MEDPTDMESPRAQREPATARRAAAPAPFLVSPRVLRIVVGAAALFVAAMLVVRAVLPAPGGWAVRGLPGVPHLARGGWLEARSPGVTLAVGERGELGTVALEPGARVRLDDEGRDVHALYLARGTVRATIFAAPRAFRIATPAGTAVDVGGACTLAVEADGAARLTVERGFAALEGPDGVGGVALVPAEYATRAEVGRAPEIPLPAGASAVLARRIAQLAAAPAPGDLALVGALDDAVVLVHLLRARSPEVRAAARDALRGREGMPDVGEDLLTDGPDGEAAWVPWGREVLGHPLLRPRTQVK
jgi:hypothetical protein